MHANQSLNGDGRRGSSMREKRQGCGSPRFDSDLKPHDSDWKPLHSDLKSHDSVWKAHESRWLTSPRRNENSSESFASCGSGFSRDAVHPLARLCEEAYGQKSIAAEAAPTKILAASSVSGETRVGRNPGQSALSSKPRGFSSLPIFPGPARRPSCASIAARKRPLP
jgi:hypothetical protein